MRIVDFVLILIVASGCSADKLSAEELIAFITDESNGLKKTVTAGNTLVSVTYRPTDLLVNQETEGLSVAQAEIEADRKKYDHYIYFVLSLSADNKESLHQATGQDYSNLLQTLSFHMNDYVALTTEKDTIPVGDFILNRTYGMSSTTDILFVFNKALLKGKPWVQFNLNEFGLGVGDQRFRFAMTDLEQVPAIEFKAIKD